MSLRPDDTEAPNKLPDSSEIATRLLNRIREELLELDDSFDVDSDLFTAGLDSMSIMQVIIMIEEDFHRKLPDQTIKRSTFSTARQIAEAVHVCGTPS